MARPSKGNEIDAKALLAIRLPIPLRAALQTIADRFNAPISDQARVAITEYVERQTKSSDARQRKKPK